MSEETEKEHDWFVPFYTFMGHRGVEMCRKCGILKRKYGKNSPCKGVVRVELRPI